MSTTPIWNGETAPGPRYPDPDLVEAGASVAAGMGNDGYIYALRAVEGESWSPSGRTWGPPDQEWRTHTRGYELLRYGTAGVDNLGMIEDLGVYRDDANDASTEHGSASSPNFDAEARQTNFNAADMNPADGLLYLAMFRDAGGVSAYRLSTIYKIDVTQTPPKRVGTLQLTTPIPGTKSGDFAIDAAGQFAYGITTGGGVTTSYKIDLNSGVVTTLASNPGTTSATGGAARLPNGAIALYGGSSVQILDPVLGTLGAAMAGPASESSDATACVPVQKPPVEPPAEARVASVPATDLWALLGLAGLLSGLGIWRQKKRT